MDYLLFKFIGEAPETFIVSSHVITKSSTVLSKYLLILHAYVLGQT